MKTSDEKSKPDRPVAFEDLPLDPRCPRCNYDLSGTLEGEAQQCPECGFQWTVEELARQYIARSRQRRGFEFFLWAFAPGPVMCVILFMGLVFGALVWVIALVGAIGFAVIMLVEWTRGLQLRSYVRGRTSGNRFFFVAGGLVALVAVNVAEVAMALVVIRVIQNLLIHS